MCQLAHCTCSTRNQEMLPCQIQIRIQPNPTVSTSLLRTQDRLTFQSNTASCSSTERKFGYNTDPLAANSPSCMQLPMRCKSQALIETYVIDFAKPLAMPSKTLYARSNSTQRNHKNKFSQPTSVAPNTVQHQLELIDSMLLYSSILTSHAEAHRG
jgi:hypothetical protein